MKNSIVITGGSGGIGSALVNLLKGLMEIKVATRHPEQLTQSPGVTPHYFDYHNAESYRIISPGDQLFIIAPPGDPHPEKTVIPFLKYAQKTGVTQITALTAFGVDQREDITLRLVERYIEDSGIPYTLLRPNFFMQLFTRHPILKTIQQTDQLNIPAGEAPLSFIDLNDIAVVAAEVILNWGDHDQKGYTLTGPEAITHREVAAMISKSTGKKIKYTPITEEQCREDLKQSGFPPPWIDRIIHFYRIVRTALCAPVTDCVEKITGKPATDFETFATQNNSIW